MPEERLFPGVLPVDAKRILAAVPDRESARMEIRRSFGISPEAFVVFFAGKYVPWKRPLDLSGAVSLLTSRGRDVVGLFAGDGPLAPEIEAAARAIGGNRIVLAGFVNQAEIPRLYAAADVLAVPSERDSHPLAVSEAATLGVPSILSERCGCIGENDVARPGETAWCTNAATSKGWRRRSNGWPRIASSSAAWAPVHARSRRPRTSNPRQSSSPRPRRNWRRWGQGETSSRAAFPLSRWRGGGQVQARAILARTEAMES